MGLNLAVEIVLGQTLGTHASSDRTPRSIIVVFSRARKLTWRVLWRSCARPVRSLEALVVMLLEIESEFRSNTTCCPLVSELKAGLTRIVRSDRAVRLTSPMSQRRVSMLFKEAEDVRRGSHCDPLAADG